MLSLESEIHACRQCPRLNEYCQKIAQTKRKSYQNEPYWGKPISGFGDSQAQLLIVGLAPGAHGANRTGRIFTGDRSGDWLYRALHKAGFASQPQSNDLNDGLKLNNAYVTCIVKCAPPENKPSIEEQENCSHFLAREIQDLSKVQVIVALGQLSFFQVWKILDPQQKKPPFKHGTEISLNPVKFPIKSQCKSMILSYHPSQQNTFTGRLTEPMFDSVFEKARETLHSTQLTAATKP